MERQRIQILSAGQSEPALKEAGWRLVGENGIDPYLKILHYESEEGNRGYEALGTGAFGKIPNCYALQAEPEESNPLFHFPENLQGTLRECGILRMQQEPFSLLGNGVLIGMVDSGIRTSLSVFQKANGRSRVVSLYDQTKTEEIWGAGYQTQDGNNGIHQWSENEDGGIYRDEEVPILGRELDQIGHGTALASILGMAAPNADFVVVKCREASPLLKEFYRIHREAVAYSEADLIEGMDFLLKEAKRLQKPMVIVIAMGSSYGDHSGKGVFERYLERICQLPGIGLVVCGGNETDKAHHTTVVSLESSYLPYRQPVSEEETFLPLDPVYFGFQSEVELDVGEGNTGFILNCWFEVTSRLALTVRTPTGERVAGVTLRENNTLRPKFVFDTTELTITTFFIGKGSGKNLILLRFVNPTKGIWTLRFEDTNRQGGKTLDNIQLYLPMTEFLSGDVRFLRPIPTVTITQPGISEEVITVGAYREETQSIASFSGRGPNADGVILPDLCAPGVRVNTVLGEYTGTGVAAVLVAGAAVLFLEWAVVRGNLPEIRNEDIKKYLIFGAERENDQIYPNIVWGYGRLNLFGVFEKLAIL